MEWFLALAGQLITAGAIWGAIRTDVKNLHEHVTEAKQAAKSAHQRIDGLLTGGRHG